MYRPDVCIHHHPCADGFTAAWAVSRRWPDIEFVPGVYGEDPPEVAGKHVLIVDFSYKRPVLERMSETALSITVLDHHKSAQLDLETFAILNPCSADDIDELVSATQPGLGNIRAEFDMTRSGARIAWDFCHPGRPVPRLVDYVQDRDLWRFELPESREIAAAIFSRPYEWLVWDELDVMMRRPDGFRALAAEGAAIERKHSKDIRELLTQTRRTMVIGGVTVSVANLPYTMAADAANLLSEGQPFAACYFDRGDGLRQFSLRSKDGGADVSAIAAGYGGGGHEHAAGFQMPLGWEGDAVDLELVALERAIANMGWPELHAFRAELAKGQDVFEDAGGFFMRAVRRLFGLGSTRDEVTTHQAAAAAMVAARKVA